MANYRVWTKREVGAITSSNQSAPGSSSQCAVVQDWIDIGGTPRISSGYGTTLLSQHTAVTETRIRTPIYILVSPTYYNKRIVAVSGQLPNTTAGFRISGLTQSDFRYHGTVGGTANCYIACIGATSTYLTTSGTFTGGKLEFNDGTTSDYASRTLSFTTYDTIQCYVIYFGV